MPGAPLTHIVFVVEEEVRVVLTGITFAGWDGDRAQVHAIDLRSLLDTDVLEVGGGAHDRFHHVAEHGGVGLDLFLARPASNQLGLLVQSRVSDVSDISQRLERGAGRIIVPQINWQKPNVPAAGQLGLAA